MIPGVHFGSGEGSAERLGGFVAGVRFLSFSGATETEIGKHLGSH